MKFETEFGLGEIVYYSRRGHEKAKHDEFLEVIAITFDKNGTTYHCRYPQGITVAFTEHDLTGDPDFNQDEGKYDYDICDG
jgi:hypothetical protein|tara:strand:- start:568 stop:810 length:243 start_codon:yes stop_codon:yes gene_type:complete